MDSVDQLFEDSICHACQKIDFSPVLGLHEQTAHQSCIESGIFLAEIDQLQIESAEDTKCSLCKLFLGFWNSWPAGHDEPLQLRAYRYSNTADHDTMSGPEVNSAHPVLVYLAVVTTVGSSLIHEAHATFDRVQRVQKFGYLFIKPEDTLVSHHYSTQQVPPLFDFTTAKAWLEFCSTNHLDCRASETDLPQSMRLIDCKSLVLASGRPTEDYAALSYVWGQPVEEEYVSLADGGAMTPRFPPTMFPRVIEDAMKATLALGMRFLWVDKYCIDQHSAEDIQNQISHMDSIYREAAVTLIAASCADMTRLPGVASTLRTPQPKAKIGKYTILSSMIHPRESIERSKWSTRGWTYQEAVLSRRRLIFTDEQVYFECSQMSCLESLRLDVKQTNCREPNYHRFPCMPATGFEEIYLPIKETERDSLPQESALGYAHQLGRVRQHIEIFTRRNLTFEGDILRAFVGILHHFATRSSSPVLHVWGLPLAKRSKLDALGPNTPSGFEGSLLWAPREQQTAQSGFSRVRVGFPSWSWSSFKGAVLFPYLDREETDFDFPLEIEFETAAKARLGLRRVGTDMEVNGKELDPNQQPVALHIRSTYYHFPFKDFQGSKRGTFDYMFVHGPSTVQITLSEDAWGAEAVLEALQSGKWRFIVVAKFRSIAYLVFIVVEQRAHSFIRIGMASVENADVLKSEDVRVEPANVRLI